MKRWLLIDDNKRWADVLNLSIMYGTTPEKTYPDVEFHTAKTYQEGVARLKEGNWDRVYLDQQLSERGSDPNGYDILDLIRHKRVPLPKEMDACSGHMGHRPVMWKMMEQLYGRGPVGEIARYQ